MKLGDLCLEQDIIAGLGNIYRAETLYLCALSPHVRLKQLSQEQFFGLMTVGAFVLSMAYQHKGTLVYPLSIFKLTQPDTPIIRLAEERGYASIDRHLVYGQQADPLGNPVVPDKAFDRTMWWCPNVQQEIA
jgi:formamidopyrimidine-DNA glycosylase